MTEVTNLGSSNVNEVIRAISIFFYEKVSQAQKKHKMLTREQKEKRQRFMHIKTSKGEKVTYSLICVSMLFVLLPGCVFVLFVLLVHFVHFVLFMLFVLFERVKSFRKKKNKEFKTALITSFTLLSN